MSSDRLRAAAAATLLLPGLVLAAACGKKGDPMPPPRKVAQPVADLAVRQRGDRLRFDFTHPKATVAGLPIEGIDAVTLFELERPAPAEGQPLQVAPQELAGARPVLEVAGAALGEAIVGDRVRLEVALPDPLPEPATARAYAVRTRVVGGEVSAPSNVAALVPRRPPGAPETLEVRPLADGVELRWSAVAEATAGYAVLRRAPERADWGAPLALVEPGATAYVDRGARYGERYVYSVVALAAREPAIESAPRAEREVDYQDRFAPAPPAGLRAVALPGEVRLVWEASPEPDLAGYRLERAAGSARSAGAAGSAGSAGSEDSAGEFAPVVQTPIVGLEHTDAGRAAGAVHRYRLRAVDRAGNVSEPGAPVEVRLP
jgi:hypothetical protein